MLGTSVFVLMNMVVMANMEALDRGAELKRRNISCLSDYSYYILTIKLRVKILKDSKADSTHVQPLIDEIDYFSSQLSRMRAQVYNCCLPGCSFRTQNHKNYVKHLRALHSNCKQNIKCKLRGCEHEFNGVHSFEIHIKQVHRSRHSLVKLHQKSLSSLFS